MLAERGWARDATLQRTDPPTHTRYRKLLKRVFTPAKVRELTPRIEEIARDLVDRFIGNGTCEFVAEFALPMPGILIAEQLGLDRSSTRGSGGGPTPCSRWPTGAMTVEEAIAEAEIELEAQHFLAAAFERRRTDPGDDLISRLVHAHGDDEEPLTTDELQDLMHQMITGGFETTTGALAKGMWLLIEHPEQMARLRADAELMKNFVEESLRFESPVQGLWRHAKLPDECRRRCRSGRSLGHGALRGGEPRSPRVRRTGPVRHHPVRGQEPSGVRFGPHYCLGAALARQEMYSSFTILLERLDDIQLSEPLPTPVHLPSFFLRPMQRLPLRFTARSS